MRRSSVRYREYPPSSLLRAGAPRSFSRQAAVLVLLAAACTTRPAQPEPTTRPPSVELRAARGEILLALAPRSAGWELRERNQKPLDVLTSASGAEVRDRDGQIVANLRPGPAGMQLVTRDGRALRVTFPRPHGDARVMDAVGVTLVAVEGPAARDAAGQIVLTVEPSGDRLVVLRGGGERAATVHNLPASEDTSLAALLLATDTLDAPSRAALVAYVLSR